MDDKTLRNATEDKEQEEQHSSITIDLIADEMNEENYNTNSNGQEQEEMNIDSSSPGDVSAKEAGKSL